MFLHLLQESYEKLNVRNSYHEPKEYDEDMFKKLSPLKNQPGQHSIERYTSASSRIYNKSLWDNPHNPEYKKDIDNIHAILKTAPPAEKDFDIYTGINPKRNKLNSDVHIPAFTSASADPYVAADFVSNPENERYTKETHNGVEHTVHHIVKIHVKKGQQIGAYIGDISKSPEEKEFLINKGHTLHFTGKHTDHVQEPYNNWNPAKIYRVHEATISTDD